MYVLAVFLQYVVFFILCLLAQKSGFSEVNTIGVR